MIKKIIFYGSILCILASATLYWNSSHAALPQTTNPNDTIDFFDTRFLAHYDVVTRTLKEKFGFQEDFFTTQDNYNINCLFLERPHAPYNVICCAGFYPGRKEGLASFYKLLPTANLFFLDARGHGKSDGSLWKGLGEYGKHEYKDIIGAIEYVKSKNNKPIILYGVCSGAFHASHALLKLEGEKRLESLNIKGLVFDSGWTSMTSTALSAPQAYLNEGIVNILSKLYGKEHKYKVPHTLPFKIISAPLHLSIKIIHSLVLKKMFSKHEQETNLVGKMNDLPTPILFIHSTDDQYIPVENIKNLANSVKNKLCWWIEKPSKHACHLLKHTDEYKKQLTYFIETALNTEQQPI